MVRQLKSKGGAWVKQGAQGTESNAPGSYGGYLYMRPAPRAYPKTSQQAKIGDAGRAVRKECKGKTGPSFWACRSDVMKKMGMGGGGARRKGKARRE